MSSQLTFNATTFLWSRTTAGIIAYPHGRTAGPSGPFTVTGIEVPFDPIHQTGGSFWELKEGPNAGWLVSAWSNSLGYGDITVVTDPGDWVPPTNPSFPHIDPLAEWRILIKAMGGDTGAPTPQTITINQPTNRYTLTKEGLIDSSHLPHYQIQPGGPYHAVAVTVPHDPIWGTGGSFYRMTDGPYAGWLISKWTNTLSDNYGPYGNMTVTQTPQFDRGPGEVIATLYRPAAHLAGASINYNDAGELHFTLLVDDPNVNVPVPKRTHYVVEFKDKDSGQWVEIDGMAGMIWDMDATDTEVVFTGVDYLGLFKFVIDDRFPASGDIETPVEKGGSKYNKWTIKQIIADQLNQAITKPDSVVSFIRFGSVDADLGKFRITTMYSTFRQTLDFIVGLINSYRAGSGKYTRIKVVKEDGKYTVHVLKDPGQARDNLLLRYGELAQGYHVIPFGTTWATRAGLIGQDKTGVKVTYKSVAGATLESEFGRIEQAPAVVQTQDTNDLLRRTNQAAVDAAALGRQISVGLKLGSYRPLEGYDLCDWVPVNIDHGAVHTMEWGSDAFGAELDSGAGTPISSGYWVITGLKWETYDDGHWMSAVTLWPKNAVPYNPGGTEPDYRGLAGRGGAGVFAMELTGAEPRPAFTPTTVSHWDAAASSFTLPSPGTLDRTRAMIAVVAIGYINPQAWNAAPPAGWTRLYNDQAGNNGAIYVMYQLFDPVTNPIPTTLSPTVSFSAPNGSAAVMVGYYADEPGVPISIRQQYHQSNSLPGASAVIDWSEDPSSDGLLLAFVEVGYYFGVSGPIRGATQSPGTLPKENLYTFVGWQNLVETGWDDSGDGRIPIHSEWGGTGGFTAMSRLAYTAADGARQAHSTGNGPPTADTTKADDYIDLVSGIQYTYDWATGQWTQVPGTGNTASGKFDFVFAAASTWVVNHTLVGYPRVTVIDSNGAVVNASVVYNSTSQITITFSSAVAGRVHLG